MPIDSERLRRALLSAIEAGTVPPASNGVTEIDGYEYTAVAVVELAWLQEVRDRARQVARGEVRVHDDSDGSRNDIATAEFILSEDNHAPAGVAVQEH